MEIKINREIREYTESMFFGLNMRQFICSILAIVAGMGLYFGLKPRIGTEAVSWACILGALPFALIGFLKYNGLTAEQFLLAWIRSEILMPKHVVFRPVNIWYELMKSTIEKKESENLIEHEQNLK